MALTETQKGRLAELLVGTLIVLGSDGDLNVSEPFVDDEGTNLIVSRKGGDRNLLIQIKSRFTLTGRGQYSTDVRRATFREHAARYILFVHFDTKHLEIGETMWLIPAIELARLLTGQNTGRKTYRFTTKFGAKGDMFVPYRLKKTDLAPKLLALLVGEES